MPNVENPMVIDGLWKDGEKHWGSDWKGDEILEGDEIVHDPQLDEVLMKEDLVDYLVKKYGFEFTTAK